MANTIPKNVWRVPVYLPFLQPPLTDEAIAEAERALGVKLPSTYIALLHEQNGGYIRLHLPDVANSMIWGIGPHFPNLVGEQWWHQYEINDDESGPWLPDDPKHLIAFDGDGHWHMCFDYRDGAPTDEPNITYVDFESESETVVALNFEDYLDMIEENIAAHTYGITSKTTIEAMVAALEPLLGATFDAADSDAHGYPVYRCALGTTENPDWLWLSANEVPRSFVRKSDSRYEELVHLLPGTTLCMPDHAQYNVILECTDGTGIPEKVLAACEAAGLTLTPLWRE